MLIPGKLYKFIANNRVLYTGDLIVKNGRYIQTTKARATIVMPGNLLYFIGKCDVNFEFTESTIKRFVFLFRDKLISVQLEEDSFVLES